MVERGYAARRAAQAMLRDFPEAPTLGRNRPLAGFVIVQRAGMPWPPLRLLRDHIHMMATGGLNTADRAEELLLVLFSEPTWLQPDLLPTALPLVAADAFTLRSFMTDGSSRTETARPPTPDGYRRLELWWNGQPHRVAIDRLTRSPIESLWDMPTLVVHQPVSRAMRDLEPGSERAASNGPAAEVTPSDEAKVSRASLQLDLPDDGLGAITAQLSQSQASPLEALRRLMGGRTGGAVGAVGDGQGGTSHPQDPGLLSALAGWLKWHTPLGNGLRRQFADRLNQVEKMIASGNVDGALKLALRLGADADGGRTKVRYPNQLPGRRASLDFDLTSPGFSLPVMSGDAFQSVSHRYRSLADQLQRDGDHRRAAYILSQLLGDHRGAVKALEQGEMYREAAKLAIDARLPPVIAIGLLFKAGDLDTALALAKRVGGFEELAEDSRRKEPEYHGYVMRAWTDMLVGSGQMLRALQVTDHLAAASVADTMLLARRKDWIADLLQSSIGDGFRPEAAARALVALDRADGRPHDLALADWIERLLHGDRADAGDQLIALIMALSRIAARDSPEQQGFWKGAGQPLLERLALALIALGSDALTKSDLQMLSALLNKAALPVLAADVDKIGKLVKARAERPAEWQVPPAEVVRAVVLRACVLGDEGMLVWRENGVLELLDRSGAVVWHERRDDVLALITIGSSTNVIVVQQDAEGRCRLARFETYGRTFHSVGLVDLRSWHDVTSEGQWLVQIGGDVGALDLERLCAADPSLHFLWSCALTQHLEVLAFGHFDRTCWITRDLGSIRPGVLELWTLWPTGLLSTQLCTPPEDEPESWSWAGGAVISLGDARRTMKMTAWTEGAEREAIDSFARRHAAGHMQADKIQSCDFDRPNVRVKATDGSDHYRVTISVPGASSVGMTLSGQTGGDGGCSVTCLARSVGLGKSSDTKAKHGRAGVILGDSFGRLLVVDTTTRRVSEI